MPTMLNLVTNHGDLDIAFEPAGPKMGFGEWNSDALNVDVGDGLVVRVAALADVIASKTAAHRPKDERALPYLESLQDQISAAKPELQGEEGTRANS